MYRLVLATQPCTLASTTGYRVYRLVLATQPCTLASTTGYRVYRLVLTAHPCTLASTTGYRVYQLVLVTQSCTLALTTGYRVYRLVLATQSCTLASTYWLQSLLTGCWRHSPYCTVLQPNWLHTQKKKKKKKKLGKYRPVAVKIHGWPQPASFLLQRITSYSKVPSREPGYRTELPQVYLVTENS